MRRGQASLEMILLVSLLVAALLSMGVYFKRAMQGRLRANFEQITDTVYLNKATNGDTTTIIEEDEERTTTLQRGIIQFGGPEMQQGHAEVTSEVSTSGSESTPIAP